MNRTLILFLFTSGLAWGSAGSFTRTCQAVIDFCDKPATNTGCKREHASIFAQQTAAVFNGEISSESHTLNLEGFLKQKKEPKLLGAAGDFIIYQGEKYVLAIPYNPTKKIHVKQVGALDSPDGGGWQVVCP